MTPRPPFINFLKKQEKWYVVPSLTTPMIPLAPMKSLDQQAAWSRIGSSLWFASRTPENGPGRRFSDKNEKVSCEM